MENGYVKTMATVYSYENKCEMNYSITNKLERRVQQAAHHAQQVHQ